MHLFIENASVFVKESVAKVIIKRTRETQCR